MKRLLALLLCLALLPFTVLAEPVRDEDETGSKPWDDESVEKVLASIEVTPPEKTEYFVGDTINTYGMTVEAIYGDGSTSYVTAWSQLDVNTLTTAGTVTVTVTYEGKTDTFDVEVIPVVVESIEVTPPAKIEYFVGDTLNTAGMTVIATYNNGDEEDVTADASINATTLNTAGTITVTVTYEGKTDTFDVEVIPVVVESIEVTLPAKTEYFVGDTLNTAGMTVKAVYNNGDEEDVTAEAEVSPVTLTNAGTATITVTYGGKSDTFDVTVIALVVESIEVTAPTKVVYNVGETLDTTGMVVTATYNNGSTANITAEATASPTTFYTEGSATVTVTYGGKSATFEVTVKKAYTPGDINGDGSVNIRDITRLKQVVAGGYDVTYVEEALDTNGDGSVNIRDITRLKQYVAGGYGVEVY